MNFQQAPHFTIHHEKSIPCSLYCKESSSDYLFQKRFSFVTALSYSPVTITLSATHRKACLHKTFSHLLAFRPSGSAGGFFFVRTSRTGTEAKKGETSGYAHAIDRSCRICPKRKRSTPSGNIAISESAARR